MPAATRRGFYEQELEITSHRRDAARRVSKRTSPPPLERVH